MSQPAIRSVKARDIVVPLKRPLKNAFGVFEAAPLVLIDVATDQGVTGRSDIFAYTMMTQKPLVHLIEQNSNGTKRRSQNILCNDLSGLCLFRDQPNLMITKDVAVQANGRSRP
jgi:hypothetical protein